MADDNRNSKQKLQARTFYETIESVNGLISPTDPHNSVDATHHGQSRAINPDSLQGKGLRDGFPDLRREKLLATSLADSLQQLHVTHGLNWPHTQHRDAAFSLNKRAETKT